VSLHKRPTTPSIQVFTLPVGVIYLVLFVDLDVNKLAWLGKKYPWEKPSCCPNCRSFLWWHGYVLAYFSNIDVPLFIRRLFCPFCRSVHRLRPSGYWPRFRSPVKEIKRSIIHRHNSGSWCKDLPRPRQRQWWRRLKKTWMGILGLSFSGDPPQAFEKLLQRKIIPVSAATKSENRRLL